MTDSLLPVTGVSLKRVHFYEKMPFRCPSADLPQLPLQCCGYGRLKHRSYPVYRPYPAPSCLLFFHL
jgi:hypothetical protein